MDVRISVANAILSIENRVGCKFNAGKPHGRQVQLLSPFWTALDGNAQHFQGVRMR